MTFTHTDVDDCSAVIGEVTRALRTGGRLVYLGLHPAYMGPFVDRNAEATQQGLTFGAGYGDETLRFDASGPIRSRVGARNLTLGTFRSSPRIGCGSTRSRSTTPTFDRGRSGQVTAGLCPGISR